MKKSKGVISLLLVTILTGLLVFTTVVGFGSGHIGAAKNIKLGLDLAGGVSITYQAKGKTPTEKEMSDTVYKLQKRVEQYSTEAGVYQEGDNRISIEIPGVTDANKVLEELGKPGSLEFQDSEGKVVLDGTDVKSATAQIQEDNSGKKRNMVSLEMTKEGKKKFADATQKNLGKPIAIVYDGQVISSPTVNSAITNGQAVIEGDFTYEEAEELASTIRIGGLQVELEEINSSVVGAQLGEEAISTSLMAGAIGLAIIFVFMCVVYLLPGLASSIALCIYTGIILVLLNAFDITLTLPGIAGIILGIGMAVDANVIIFARVKEELAAGRNVKTALKKGFQKALSAILDGNITTLIAALVLGLKGTGTVKGFAQTLALGIVVSMFTALVVTRVIIFAFYAIGLRSEKLYGVQKERKTINFLGKRKVCFVISIALVLSGFVAMGVQKSQGNDILNYSLEFKGGTATNVTFNEDYSIKELDAKVTPVIEKVTGDKNVQMQKVKGTKQVVVKTQVLDLKKREALNRALVDNFKVDEKKITYNNISSTVSSEMRKDAIIAVLIATVCMLIYIWLRFKDFRFASSAIIALLHDVLVVLAFYAIARVSVGNTFIACMLTIVGYSINATIVIFDRIREELKTGSRKDTIEDVVNRSITQTLTRSIYTSFTTFVMVATLYVLGVSSVKEFAAPLMVGVVVGAYSSVCITGALWYVMKKKFVKK
ncbi:MAG: protein translocase subunit SecD [Lachnospiraceae bacterium]|nr:protein translocase subunit SecD [Lachnospiraceae bacterium]